MLYTELANAPIVRNQNPSGSPEHHGNDANDANLNYFNCHSSGTTYEVLTVPSEPNSFMSCGEDGTVRLFDLRQISRCHKTCCKDNILILSPSAVTAMCLSPRSYNYIAVGRFDCRRSYGEEAFDVIFLQLFSALTRSFASTIDVICLWWTFPYRALHQRSIRCPSKHLQFRRTRNDHFV